MSRKSPSALFVCTLMLCVAATFSMKAQYPVVLYHANGELKTEGAIDSEGRPHELWKEYDASGDLLTETRYRSGVIMEQSRYAEQRRLSWHLKRSASGQEIYRSYHPNGMLAAHADIDPILLSDSMRIIDRAYFVSRFDVNGQFISNHIHVPTASPSGMAQHELYSRSRPQRVSCLDNELSWHAFSGIASAKGHFDLDHGPKDISWPERGVASDEARQFKVDGYSTNRLTSYFIDRLPYGEWKNYYPNDQLWYRLSFEKGVPDGVFESFYIDGSPAMKCTFVAGQLDGECLEWWPDGSVRSRSTYLHGRPIGEWMQADPSGHITASGLFAEVSSKGVSGSQMNTDSVSSIAYGAVRLSGVQDIESGLLYELRFQYADRPIGLTVTLDAEAKPIAASYHFTATDYMRLDLSAEGGKEVVDEAADTFDKKGAKAMFKKLSKSGPLFSSAMWAKGASGTFVVEYPDGTKWWEHTLVDGQPEGWSRVYGIDGKLMAEGRFEQGTAIGTHRWWGVDGRLLEEMSFDEGLLDGEHTNWHPGSDQKQRVLMLSKGLFDGTNSHYTADGRMLASKQFKNGLAHGREEDPLKGSYTTYRMDSLHGPAKEVMSDGSVWAGEYRAGHRYGPWIIRSADGKEREVTFVRSRELVESDPDRCRYAIEGPLVDALTEVRPLSQRMDTDLIFSWIGDDVRFDLGEYAALKETGYRSEVDSARLVIDQGLSFDYERLPGFEIDLAPALLLGQYETIDLSWVKKDYFLRDMPRFDEQAFEGTAMDYLHVGAAHFGLDEPSLRAMFRDRLSELQRIETDSAEHLIDSRLEMVGAADSEQVMSQLLGMLIDAPETSKTEAALEEIDALFSPLAGEDYRLQMDRQIGQYTIDLRTGMVSLIMPEEMLSEAKGLTERGARLSFSPDLLQYNTTSGLTVINDRDHCFSEGYIGGSGFSFDFDRPEIVMKPRKLRELISQTQDYYFFAENLGLDFTGVFVPEAWGKFETADGNRVFLEYANIGINDKYMAGRLKIDLAEEHSHEVFKEMEQAFTYHEIISEWDGLEVYFMRLKPKNP